MVTILQSSPILAQMDMTFTADSCELFHIFARGAVDRRGLKRTLQISVDRISPKAGGWSGSRGPWFGKLPESSLVPPQIRNSRSSYRHPILSALPPSLVRHDRNVTLIQWHSGLWSSSRRIISKNVIFRRNKSMLRLAGTENLCDDAGPFLNLLAEFSQPLSRSQMKTWHELVSKHTTPAVIPRENSNTWLENGPNEKDRRLLVERK